jgi:hypothetical protein
MKNEKFLGKRSEKYPELSIVVVWVRAIETEKWRIYLSAEVLSMRRWKRAQ